MHLQIQSSSWSSGLKDYHSKVRKKGRAISDSAFHSPIKKIVCLTSCPPTFHVLRLCLHVPEAVDVMRPCFAVAFVVFEIADVSELQAFDCISFAVVV
jgi:hypothetical protein